MAKSIKLGSDTYLDATGVVIDNAGKTLAAKMTEINDNGKLTNGSTIVASEADINAVIQGTQIMNTTSAFSIGGITVPAYSRLLKINYYSSDGAIIGVTPNKGLIILFRSNSTWSGRIL